MLKSLKRYPVHIRGTRLNISHPDAITMCGQRIHAAGIKRKGRNTIASDADVMMRDVVHTVTLNAANRMDGVDSSYYSRADRLVPATIRGPDQSYLTIFQCNWCLKHLATIQAVKIHHGKLHWPKKLWFKEVPTPPRFCKKCGKEIPTPRGFLIHSRRCKLAGKRIGVSKIGRPKAT